MTDRPAWRIPVLLLLLVAVVWFGSLDFRALIRPDEGRYAEIPREMKARGDWTTPRLNDIKYFEKPPLQYWATAAAYTAFGEHHWTARLWPALTGFGGMLLAYLLGARLWGRAAGTAAAAMLAGTTLYSVMGRVLTLDMGLTFFLQLALTGFVLAQGAATPQSSRRWMWLAWAGTALAILSKGPVALVLTGIALVGYSLANRDLAPWRKLSPLSGIAVLLAIAAPWFVAVSLANPEFPHFFFIHEHLERYLTKEHRRYEPGWYFIVIYFAGALPFAFLYLHGLLRGWGRRVAGQFSPERFLAVFALGTFAFFSFSDSKLPSYILPIFPPLALLAGRTLTQLSRKAMLAHVAALAAIAAAAVVYAPHAVNPDDPDYLPGTVAQFAEWARGAALLWLTAIVGAGVLVWRKRALAALIVLGIGSLLAETGLLAGHDALSGYYSSQAAAARIRPLLTPGVPFYSVDWYDQTLPFYLGRTVSLVVIRGEMGFGIEQEPEKLIPTVEAFKQRWQDDRDAFALMPPDIYDRLEAEGLPMDVIARDKSVYVRKPR